MSHQDPFARGEQHNSADLSKALQWLSAGIDWSAISLRRECSWTPCWLVQAALCWAWSNETTLIKRFKCGQRLIQHLQSDEAKVPTSYQAFLKLLKRWTVSLILSLQLALRRRMQTLSPADWQVHGFVVFGVDGSKIEVPRTKANQQAYAPSRPGTKANKRNRRRKPDDHAATKKTQQPQMWLTSLFHVGLHLPWDWRIGPSDSSERAHALEMLDTLPANSLLTGDAGFVGYYPHDGSKTLAFRRNLQGPFVNVQHQN